MALFKWNDSLSVRVASFDAHHKRLVDIINELHNFMLNGRPQMIIEKTIMELLNYTKYHFEDEERVMLAHEFPGYAEHKAEHDNFVAKVNECMNTYKSSPLSLTIDLMDFLREWLTGHIMMTDKQYSGFLNDRGVA